MQTAFSIWYQRHQPEDIAQSIAIPARPIAPNTHEMAWACVAALAAMGDVTLPLPLPDAVGLSSSLSEPPVLVAVELGLPEIFS